MAKVSYEIKENNGGVLKTTITQDVEIDLAASVKNIRMTRAEFIKAWSTLYEMAAAMEAYAKQHAAQNEFLDCVEASVLVGVKYQLPELVSPFNSEEIKKALEEFKAEETARRTENLQNFKDEQATSEAKPDEVAEQPTDVK